MQVLIDTSILLRLVVPDDANFASSLRALEVLREQRHVTAVVPQNLYEFWVVATRPSEQNGLGLSPREAEAELERVSPPRFRLLLDERGIFPNWKQLVTSFEVRGKLAHDTRLVAAMQRWPKESSQLTRNAPSNSSRSTPKCCCT